MTQGKGKRDEKLIEELYEKLYWYTYEAGEKEFDCNEVDAIVRLLDVLDPKEDDPKFPSDPVMAFERFKSRFGLEEEFAEVEAGYASGRYDGKTDTPAVSAPVGCGNVSAVNLRDSAPDSTNTEQSAGMEAGARFGKSDIGESGEDRKRKRRGHRTKWKKWLGRTAIGAAACLVLMLSVNFGSYALKKKSFFEVVREEVGRTKVTVTGNVEGIDDGEAETVQCDSWIEVEELIGEKILKPQLFPDGYILDKITYKDLEYKRVIVAKYNKNTKVIKIEIDIYDEAYSDHIILFDEDWQLLKEDAEGNKAQYYVKDGQIQAAFAYKKAVYYFYSDDTLAVVEQVLNNMQ